MKFNHNITIIGSGNVAWHLVFAFTQAGVSINKVISRNKEHAKELAKLVKADFGDQINAIRPETTLVLICVTDSAVENIISGIQDCNIPFAHTAGSIPLPVIEKSEINAGVFYPFQTFTKNVRMGDVDFPVCIEATSGGMLEMLKDLASKISKRVIELDSPQRKKLHLAGIFANNFSNYLFTKAFKYLESNNIESNLLIPLIDETVKKIHITHPEELQTGPARRNNKKIIEEHLSILASDKNLSELYSRLSKDIIEYYKIKHG